MNATDERASRLREAIRLKRAGARSRRPELPPRPPDRPALLGEMQRSLWLLHRIQPRSPAYNLVSAFRVRGELEVARLEGALDRVVERHRLLRSTFREGRGGVLQVVREGAPIAVEVVDVEPGAGVTVAVAAAREPFDLERGPLLRVGLIRERSGEPLLLLVLHHILADERSLGIFWGELAAAYAGQLPREPPAVQYDDYVHWAGRRAPEERRRELEFWRRRLDPLPEELQLPFESPPGSERSGRGGRLLGRSLAAEIAPGIRRLATAAGCSPFAIFAFAFRLLLDRYTGGRPYAFATPASTRSHPATAEMLGYFLNPVVVPVGVDERQPVESAVRELGGELRRLLAHSSLPFQTLAEELSPPRRPDRHPLFQAMFVHQEVGEPPILGEARLEPVALDLGESKFDLTLFVGEGAGSLEIAVEYRTDRFEEVWMHNLLGHYETLLAELPADPGRATAEVPMADERQRAALAAAAAGPELAGPAAAFLPRRIHEQARRSPGLTAVVCAGESWTYGRLSAAAGAVARQLGGRGVEAGDRVGLFVARSPRMIAGILGSHLAGAAYVPLDPDYPEARNRDVLEDAEVAAVLTTAGLRGRLPGGSWPVVEIDGLEDGAAEPPEPSTGDVAYLLYTSGSTGRPKGVVVTHANLAASNAARERFYERPPGRFLLVPSVAFDSSVAGLFWALSTAGTLVIPTEEEVRDARLLARLVAEAEVTSLLCVPSLYAQLLAVGAERLAGLETVIVAGESCPPRLVAEHLRRLPGVRLFNEYGPTEATVWATARELDATDASGPVSIGRPIPGVGLHLLDRLGRPVPAGVPGEAWIEGPTVARGYWRRRELTDERFATAPESGARRYRTGDRMAWTLDHRLLFLGREDEQIKLRGFRIEPGEIEAALLEQAAVEQVAVVARAPGSGAAGGGDAAGNALVAFVVGGPVGEEWRGALGRRLPAHMIPSRLVELSELPRLPNGKVDRRRLVELPLAARVGSAEGGPPPSARERALLALWRGLLGVEEIGVDDNFFELGGHSLLTVEMAVAVESDFEVSLSPAEVFENPTVRQLARRIERRGGSETLAYRHLYAIQPTGPGMPLIVALPHFFTEMLAERFRGERPVYGLRGVGLRPEGNLGRWRTMRELVEELVEEVGRRFGDGPRILAGYSFGASMAFEAARLMEERGLPVHRLYLIAPMPVDVYRWGPLGLQLDGLRQPLAEFAPGEALGRWLRGNSPLTRAPYRRAKRWLLVEPWRRLLRVVGRLRLAVGLPLTERILYADVRVDRFRLHARYRPAPVCTPTVFFNPREPQTDAAATWRPFFRGPLTVVETPDPHLEDDSLEAARQVILEQLGELGEEAC